MSKTAAKSQAKVEIPYGLRKCFEAIVERGGWPPARRTSLIVPDLGADADRQS
ncbi:hypothetical protein ACWEKM_45570 [Streptomyces sp. NPDC004752]